MMGEAESYSFIILIPHHWGRRDLPPSYLGHIL